MSTVAVVILTYNEEKHLDRALRSVARFADEIFVVDSFSSDQTVNIAKKHGAIIFQNTFINQAKQFQWAMDNLSISSDWIMRLDADEVVEDGLAQEIISKLPLLPATITGVNLKRKLVFLGRTIKHGGRGTLTMLRIWRRGAGQIEDRWMDEHIFVKHGKTTTFEGSFYDHNLNDLSHFTDKHNKYATREAIQILNQRLGFMVHPELLCSQSSSLQASWKQLVKQTVYNRIPFQFSAFAYFLYRFIIRLGFLDGREGLIYNVLQGFWYRFLVGAKVEELNRTICHLSDRREIASELGRLTGLKLSSHD